jgi:hypothetical protein
MGAGQGAEPGLMLGWLQFLSLSWRHLRRPSPQLPARRERASTLLSTPVTMIRPGVTRGVCGIGD